MHEIFTPTHLYKISEDSPGTELAILTKNRYYSRGYDQYGTIWECYSVDLSPIPDKLDAVVEKNRELLLQRSQVGIKKYGVTLDTAEINEEEILQHALEEALDFANYLQTRLMKIRKEI